MPSTFTIQQILSFAAISQYLASNEQASGSALKSGSIITTQPALLYVEGSILQSMYTLNPNGPTIRSTAEYVLSLCGKYLSQAQAIVASLLQNPPIVAGPSDQSVAVGVSATFTISVTSTLPYTIAWYDGFGNLIPGQTGLSYVFPNAQVSDSGKTFYAKATNAAGTTTSATASLTVTASIIAKWWFGSTDPFAALSSGTDTLTYQISQSIVHNQPIVINYPIGAQNNQFNVLRYPDTENDKTTWVNTPGFNFGSIPDSVMRAIFSINGFKYIVSRNAMSLDSVTTTLTYS